MACKGISNFVLKSKLRCKGSAPLNHVISCKGHLIKKSEDDNMQSLAVQQLDQAFVAWMQRSPLLVGRPRVTGVDARLL